MSSILFVASEALPFVKSGGLADVTCALPRSLMNRNQDVRVVLPLYKRIAENYREGFERLMTFDVIVGVINTVATIYKSEVEGVTYYFIEHQGYFERDGLYGYVDDGERFAFFQKASLEMLKYLNFYPDIIHSHDWHAGMIAALCKFQYGHINEYSKIKHVYTIHNLAYQGNYPASMLENCLGLSINHYYDGSMRFYDGISFMKSGIVFSDKISTVSNTYAHEILTPEYGENMDSVLRFREHDLWGIVNGIDVDQWNPETDKSIVKNYLLSNYKSGKKANKKKLQAELGLPDAPNTLIVAMVSRLTWQKGVSLIIEKLADMLALDIQLVILGSGDKSSENILKDYEHRFRRKFVFYCGYNEILAHQVYAGADVLLMPSQFEPCGISQLIAMRYGTLPLVRETGGLKDTVMPFNQYTNEGTGFSFYPFNSHDMWSTLKFAHDTYYYNKDGFNHLIENAMKTDVSFEKSTDLYMQMYGELV